MIDTKALRSKVLDLAIQGKLTEQLESEDADYNDIILSDKRPYSIPRNWKWTNIQSIISKDVGGGTPSKAVSEYWNNGDIPWMSVKDFSSAQNGLLSGTTDHITELGLNNSSSNLVDKNAIIICMRMALGKIVRITKPMAINQDLRAVWLKECIDNNYFFYFYSTLKVEGHGMTVAGISKKQLMEYPFPLPPLAEQKRIVERVEEIFKLLDIIDEAQAKYSADAETLKSKLITMGIQGKLTEQLESDGTAEELFAKIQEEKQRLIKEGKIKKEKPLPPVADEEIPFEIPRGWKWVRFGELMRNRDSERVPVSVEDRKKLAKKYDYYGASGIIDKVETYLFDKTLLLIGEDGANLLIRSTPIAFLAEGKYWVNNHAHVLDTYVGDYHTFVMHYINSISLVPYVTGSAQPKLNQENMSKIPVPLPPLAEQKRIADKLDEILRVIG